jgi:hypothetical protein
MDATAFTGRSRQRGRARPIRQYCAPPQHHQLVGQFVLLAGAALLYFGVRGLTQGNRAAAVAHGFGLLRFERALGLDVESTAQAWLLHERTLVTLANWVYIWGHWPVIVGTLVWLHRRHRADYLLLRNAMFVSGAIGLVVFAAFPVAPPRLLAAGLVDTVTELSNSYRVLQPPALVNKYAALPSLHVGWNLLVGIVVFRATRRRVVRLLAVLSPLSMAAAVVLTANHYVLDGLAGMVVALVGLAVSARLAARHRRCSPRVRHPEVAEQVEVVDDEPGHAPTEKSVRGVTVVHRPGEEDVAAFPQAPHELLVEELGLDPVAVHPAAERQPA